MKNKMVSPDGEVWEIDPSEMPIAQAHGFVSYGSPEHMAQLGVKGPDSLGKGVDPNAIIQPDSTARTIAAGLGKSAVKSAAGLVYMGQKTPKVDEFVAPANTTEDYAQTGGDVAQMALPAGIAAKIGGAGKLAMAARVAAQAAGTGVVSKAQGRSFAQGATEGALGGAVGEAASMAEPAIQAGLRTPMAKRVIGHAGGITLGGDILGRSFAHLSPEVVAAQLGAAALLTKKGRTASRAISRILPGGWSVIRARGNENSVSNIADSEGHDNKD